MGYRQAVASGIEWESVVEDSKKTNETPDVLCQEDMRREDISKYGITADSWRVLLEEMAGDCRKLVAASAAETYVNYLSWSHLDK